MTVLSALFGGLCVFTAAYGLLVHLFVALKWESGDFTLRYTPIHTVNPPLPQHLKEWIAQERSTDTDEIDKLIDAIKSLPTTEGTMVGKASELLDDHSSELAQLDPVWTNHSSPNFIAEGHQTTLSIWRLNNLLTRGGSLSSMEDDRVDSLLNGTMTDLQDMADQKDGLKWQTVVGLLDPETPFPEKVVLSEEELLEELCELDPIEDTEEEEDDDDDDDDIEKSSDDQDDEDSSEDEEEEDKEDSTSYYVADEENDDGSSMDEIDTSLYAQEADLDRQTMNLRSLLGKRARDLPRYFQESYDLDEQIQNATEALDEQFAHARDICETSVQETSDNIAAFEVELPDGEDDEEDCEMANEEDVLLLVEAGLDALARRHDLRDALLKVLGQLDPEAAKGLILDADLATEPAIPTPQTVEQVPLLRMLDSPIMGQAASFVDALLDHIGGHYDPLDQYVDQLAEQLVDAYNKDAKSLGTVFVRYLFVQSGHWAVPMPPLLRDYLESSGRGREWLAALS